MNSSHCLSKKLLLQTYILSLISSLIGTTYVLVKPGISVPTFPDNQLSSVLKRVGSSTLSSLTKLDVDKNSSDRKLSPIYKYSYSDGSSLLATIVKVRKRDDFKIETYGLLTKNIDPIYLKNSTFLDIVPPSLLGTVSNTKFIQTCIIPGTNRLEDSDFRLGNLTTIIEKLYPKKTSIFDKLLGTRKHINYSCLVLTYQLSSNPNDLSIKKWQNLVREVQSALKSKD
jgi:hypothetical protein